MAQKKIFFDGLGLVDGHFSGIGHYILGILRGLDEIIEREKTAGREVPSIEVIIPYTTRARFNTFGFKHIKPKLLPIRFRIMAALWHRGKMPPLDLYCGRGFYVFTRFVTMPLAFSPSAVIIYDVSFELYKQYSDERNAAFLSAGTKKSLKQVQHVFTISESAKREIVDFYKYPENEVTVATPAADQHYFYRRSAMDIKRIKDKYGIKKDYILALSNLEPRKNLEVLVDAYCKLSAAQRKDTSLLLVGVDAWKSDKLFQKIIVLVQEGYDIIRPSKYVTDDDRAAIISGAKMLVFPSHYEGFGMPPLEAMACGVPVITADNSSLPEVVGAAGTMLDCMDVDGFAAAMGDYLENLEKVTKKSIVAGPEKASTFAWHKSAQAYWDYLLEATK